jgi:diaminopimelate epimerase
MSHHDHAGQTGIAFSKGHGTGNDFVVIADPGGTLDLTPARVAAICSRRTGIGADGVLRAVRVEHMDISSSISSSISSDAQWFMDYRNADGSLAEMCGNGARVFALFLFDHGLIPDSLTVIATRGGDVTVEGMGSGSVVVDMGVLRPEPEAHPTVSVGDRSWAGVALHVPNPHCVVAVESLDDAGDLRHPPTVSGDVFPHGVNVEFMVAKSSHHIAMRVHERGSGETLSCGTGACAAAYAHALDGGFASDVWTIDVDVLGGHLRVSRHEDGHLFLEGPAEFVAHGVMPMSWWEAIA